MAGMKTLVVGFFVLLSLVVHASPTETKTVTFDMKQTSYEQFMNQGLYKVVLKTTVATTEGVPKLGQQKVGRVPDTWIHVLFKTGAKGEVAATLAVRADNLYIMGFKAIDGAWYGFKNTAYLLPRATELSFDDTYKGLTGAKDRAYEQMVHVAVGKAATEQATLTLANYKVGGAISEEDVRKALATMVLTISEGQRLAVIKQNVTALWAAGGTVSPVGIALLVKWSDISCALLVWEKEKAEKKKAAKWGNVRESKIIDKFGDPLMLDAAAAAKNLGFVLDAKSCSK